jgi:hypothetical protein
VRATALLSVAAATAFTQFVGHGTLFVRSRPTHGPEEVAVVEAMRTHAFAFAAAPRTYWDMYFGYGLEAAFICLVEAVLLWQLASLAASAPKAVRPMVALVLAANIAHLVMLARYFAFPLPMMFDAAIAALLGWALFVTRLPNT